MTEKSVAKKVADTLSAMHGRGTITPAQVEAGRRFQQQWDAAHGSVGIMRYDQFADTLANGIRPAPSAAYGGGDPRGRLDATMRALGGVDQPAGRVAWYVLGQGETLKQFAGWTHVRRDDVGAHLVAALGVLVGHYGLGEVRTAPAAA